MSVEQPLHAPAAMSSPCSIEAGTILVSGTGQIKILRSRNATNDGWNCADGAGLADSAADDRALWSAYTPESLAADLSIAAELHDISGDRQLSGGLATWDACSGRPCQLPKIAKLVN